VDVDVDVDVDEDDDGAEQKSGVEPRLKFLAVNGNLCISGFNSKIVTHNRGRGTSSADESVLT